MLPPQFCELRKARKFEESKEKQVEKNRQTPIRNVDILNELQNLLCSCYEFALRDKNRATIVREFSQDLDKTRERTLFLAKARPTIFLDEYRPLSPLVHPNEGGGGFHKTVWIISSNSCVK
jgi:hypothetical protein